MPLRGEVEAVGQSDIQAPFGLRWGESWSRIREVLEAKGAAIVGEEQVGERTRREVEGIPQRNLLRTYFYFEGDLLGEVELHLGHPSWQEVQYTRYFGQTRQLIDRRYGRGAPVTMTKFERDGVQCTFGGIQWRQGASSIRLFLFLAKKGEEKSTILSLHYRGL